MADRSTARRSQSTPSEPIKPLNTRRPAMKVAERKTAAAAKTSMSNKAFDKKTIALVYDFDGTLCPRPMQEYAFLPKIGANPEEFWAESNRIAREQGADPMITYMHLLYKKAKAQAACASTATISIAQGG